jgi:hypothetical protein
MYLGIIVDDVALGRTHPCLHLGVYLTFGVYIYMLALSKKHACCQQDVSRCGAALAVGHLSV